MKHFCFSVKNVKRKVELSYKDNLYHYENPNLEECLRDHLSTLFILELCQNIKESFDYITLFLFLAHM